MQKIKLQSILVSLRLEYIRDLQAQRVVAENVLIVSHPSQSKLNLRTGTLSYNRDSVIYHWSECSARNYDSLARCIIFIMGAACSPFLKVAKRQKWQTYLKKIDRAIIIG